MKYPIYIISKGRSESRLTSKALENMNIPYRIVIEPQEYDAYSSVINPEKILVLPFSNLGQGSIPARNWVWEHSIKEGHERHWILDDNIRDFRRINNNQKKLVKDDICFTTVEEITDKYTNIGLSGLQYSMFIIASARYKLPFTLNTRIYSCILIRNDLPVRWRGKYNEDTDLSLRVLKLGYCTLLYRGYTCSKNVTLKMKGGNTDELYKQNDEFDGRLEMAKSLVQQHPDCVTIKRKWHRWQHSVDYSRFKNLLLRKK